MQGSSYKSLRDIPALRDLSEKQCATLGPKLMALRLSAGAVLSTEGQASDTVYIVVAGDVQAHAPSGLRTRPVKGAGLVIGIHAKPAAYSVSMQSDGAALCFPAYLIAALELFETMAGFSLTPALINFSEEDTSPPDLIVLSRMLPHQYYERGLDLGCGAGRFSAHLITRVGHFTMLDQNADVLKEASRLTDEMNREGTLERVAADFHALPFQDHTFDLVVSRLAFHESNSLNVLLSEVFRIVAPGGNFALVDVIPPVSGAGKTLFERLEKTLDPHFCNPPSEAGWARLLSQAGFINVALRTVEISRSLADRPGGEMATADCLEKILGEASAEVLTEMAFQRGNGELPVSQLRWKDRRVVIVAEKGE